MQPDRQIEEQLRTIPPKTGVYLMKNADEQVIYVGKAVNLRSRVNSYFGGSRDARPSVGLLLPEVARIDFLLTATEKEALILENNLIKQFRPKYNIVWRDDKNFVCLKLDVTKPFPRLEVVRKFQRDGALYFGPYTSAKAARMTLREIGNIFPLRKCPDAVFRKRARPCLNYQMGRCLGPCSGQVDEREYRRVIDDVTLFLRGRNKEVIERLRSEMERASNRLDFERAAQLRDRIDAIQKTVEAQAITLSRPVDRDVFGYYAADSQLEVEVMFVRSGRLVDFTSYTIPLKSMKPAQAFQAFLEQFYSGARFVPREVLLPGPPVEDAALLEEHLTEIRGEAVRILTPQRGESRKLVEMARTNAQNAYLAKRRQESATKDLLETLGNKLGLARVPRVMECFDISNIRGTLAVGSMVRFREGEPDKAHYRHFKIRTVGNIDDYSMIREVLRRRYARAIAEKDLPDLAVIDGGKGHLGVAEEVFREMNISDVDLIAVAKGRSKSIAERRLEGESIFVRGAEAPIPLRPSAPEMRVLQQLRDEAHRFAITYHRKLRAQPYEHTELEGIPGIGPKTVKAVLAHFGNLGKLREASAIDMSSVKGVTPARAEALYQALHPGESSRNA